MEIKKKFFNYNKKKRVTKRTLNLKLKKTQNP